MRPKPEPTPFIAVAANPSAGSSRAADWLILARVPGLGSIRLNRLLDRYRDPSAILRAPRDELRSSGIGEAGLARLMDPDPTLLREDLNWLSLARNHLLTRGHPDYPPLLAQVPDPPPLLFVHGDPATLSRPQLAIVGSRNPSPAGRGNAREFARFLAASGIAITSGMAIGIDAAAHEGALAAPGITVAVTGTGLDRVYPARHRELAHQIAAAGALISEFPPGTPAKPGHFPRRNRVISGLSLGTLVVEAAQHSGSLITARLASEQGREVFAIPGSIHNPLSRGCHSLIRQGAKLVETAQDIIEELGPLLGRLETVPGPSGDREPAATDQPDLTADYQALLDSMGHDPVTVDELIQRSGWGVDVVSSMLLLLELKGHVSSAPGGRFSRSANEPG